MRKILQKTCNPVILGFIGHLLWARRAEPGWDLLPGEPVSLSMALAPGSGGPGAPALSLGAFGPRGRTNLQASGGGGVLRVEGLGAQQGRPGGHLRGALQRLGPPLQHLSPLATEPAIISACESASQGRVAARPLSAPEHMFQASRPSWAARGCDLVGSQRTLQPPGAGRSRLGAIAPHGGAHSGL